MSKNLTSIKNLIRCTKPSTMVSQFRCAYVNFRNIFQKQGGLCKDIRPTIPAPSRLMQHYSETPGTSQLEAMKSIPMKSYDNTTSKLRDLLDESPLEQPFMSSMTLQSLAEQSTQMRKNTETPPVERSIAQLQYKNGVYIICTIKSDDIKAVQRHLAPVMLTYGANHFQSLSYFHNTAYIDALLSPQKLEEFVDFEKNLIRDAVCCGAESASIVSFERGIVRFQCSPTQVQEVIYGLKSKEYQIRSAKYNISPKLPVYMSEQEQRMYKRFMNDLSGVPGLEYIYDNVKRVPY